MTNSETKNFSQNVSSSYHLKDKGNNAPKLRFKGYNDEWKHLNFKSITTMIKDGTHGSYNDLSEGIPLLSAKDIDNGKVIIPDDCRRISLSDYNDIYKNYSLKINDILLTIVGTIGRVALVSDITNKYAFQRSVGILRANEYNNPQFILYLLQTDFIKKQFYSKVNQSAQGGIYLDTLGKIDFKIPTLPEQEKIASFLTLIDKKIEKQKELVELLKKYKRGLLSQIFSQKLRFKDENGNNYPAWEEKTLGEVTNNISYGLNAAAKKYDGKNKYIRITDIDETTGKYNKIDIVSPDCDLSDEYKLKINDLLFARTGASTGKTYLYDENDGEMYFAGFLIKFSIKEEYCSNFVFYITQTYNYKKWVSIMSARSGQPGINAKEYSKYKFFCPVLEEQVKISNIISKLDNIIEKENLQLNLYNDYKKGLLQQMFI